MTRNIGLELITQKGWRCAAALFVLILSGLMVSSGHAEDESRLELTDWKYTRIRKTINGSNKILASIAIKNVSGKALSGMQLSLHLRSAMGEKAMAPLRKSVGGLRAGEKKVVQWSAMFVPAFEAYELHVSYQGGKEKWISNSADGDPEFASEALIPGVGRAVLLGQELAMGRYKRFKRFQGKVRVKNVGAEEATDVKIHVIFYGPPPKARKSKRRPKKSKKTNKKGKNGKAPAAKEPAPKSKGKVLGEWSGVLGTGTLAGGEEKILNVVVPMNIPRGYHGITIKVSSKETPTEAQMAGGDFENLKELELAHWTFDRKGKKQDLLEVTCKARNGLPDALENIKIGLTFFTENKGKRKTVRDFKYQVPGTMKAGEVKEITFNITKVPQFDAYEQSVEYGQAAGKTVPKQKKAKALKFAKKETVEVLFKEFETQADGTVLIVCAARNGRPFLIKNLVVKVQFLKKDGSVLSSAVKKILDPMRPTEVRNFVIRGKGAKGFAQVTNSVAFVESRPAPKKPESDEKVVEDGVKDEAENEGKTSAR